MVKVPSPNTPQARWLGKLKIKDRIPKAQEAVEARRYQRSHTVDWQTHLRWLQ